MRRCTICEAEKDLEQFAKHAPSLGGRMRWCRDCYKIKRLEYRYGLGPGEYHARLEAQDHRCPICGKHADDVQRPRNHVVPLVVDHCHETGVVRGLLCWQCNSGLGHFRDDVQALKAAMEYLS